MKESLVERESNVGFELPAVDTIRQDLKDNHKEVEISAKAIDLLSVKSVQVVQVSQRITKSNQSSRGQSRGSSAVEVGTPEGGAPLPMQSKPSSPRSPPSNRLE